MAFGVHWLNPALRPKGLSNGWFYLFCVGAGITVERIVHTSFGWYTDPGLRHLVAKREAELGLARLKHYEEAGIIDAVQGKKLAYRIARADVISGLKPKVSRGPRGPYKKRVTGKVEPGAPGVPPNPKALAEGSRQ